MALRASSDCITSSLIERITTVLLAVATDG